MLRRLLYQGVYTAHDDRAVHLAALRNLELSSEEQHAHDHLYDCLSILDDKATGLLGFDSILIATSAIILTILGEDVTAGSLVIFAALVFAGISSTLNLIVIQLTWTETSELNDPAERFDHLLRVRNRRSLYYRWSWLAALCALALVVIGIIAWRSL